MLNRRAAELSILGKHLRAYFPKDIIFAPCDPCTNMGASTDYWVLSLAKIVLIL